MTGQDGNTRVAAYNRFAEGLRQMSAAAGHFADGLALLAVAELETRPGSDDDALASAHAAAVKPIPQFLPGRWPGQSTNARPENSTRARSEGLPDNARDVSADTTVGITGAALPVEAGIFVTVTGAGDPAPVPDAKTRRDQVLDLWAETDLSRKEIAERVGCSPSSPDTFIATARRGGDPRVSRGEALRKGTAAETATQLADRIADDFPALSAEHGAGLTFKALQHKYGLTQTALFAAMTVLELRGKVRRTKTDRTRWHLPEAPAASRSVPEVERRVPRHVETNEITTLVPARRKEAAKPAAVDHSVRALVPARSEELHLVPVTPFMAIDETANVVAGPKGEWQTHRPCVLTLRRLGKLQPGQFLDAATLSGPAIDKKGILDSMPTWQRELDRIGIEVVKVGREMFALRAAA